MDRFFKKDEEHRKHDERNLATKIEEKSKK
jgi:hypothetical protein